MNPKIRTTFIPLAVFIAALALQGCNSTDCSEMVYTINRFDDHNDGACDSDCSLREAIIRSNECPGTQTLLLPAGTYNLAISGGWELGAAAGDLNLDDDVIIIGQGLAVIDANGIDNVFSISRRVTVEMHNFYIRGGYSQSGAGIINTGALTMHDSVVAYNNSTSSCGGIYSYWAEGWGTLSLFNTRVHDNMANIGGGICSWESLDMQGGSVDNNYANLHGGLFLMGEADLEGVEIWGNESGGDGGGISIGAGAMVENDINLTGVEILGNTSGGNGGGILHLKGALMLDKCAIYDNLAEQAGGGIALEGQTPAVIGTEVRIENNEAQSGGGIYNAGSVLLYQSSLSGNRATNGRGGAIYTEQSEGGNPSVWLRNSTVSGNTASVDWSAGGLHNQVGSMRLEWVTIVDNSPRGIVNTSSGNITQDIVGSIVANNAADNCGWTANFTSRGHNLEDDDTCGFNGVADMVNTDPLLGALGDNGGFTLTHAPLIGSPAIDTGASSWCLA